MIPASDMIRIKTNIFFEQDQVVEILNTAGERWVMKQHVNEDNEIEIVTSFLPVGLYVCRISDGSKTVVKKIIFIK